MRRYLLTLIAACGLLCLWPLPATAATNGYVHRATCAQGSALCTEVVDSIGVNGAYTGHDEPSVLFYSNVPGSGNSQVYHLTLPKDPKTLPQQDGSGGTFNFQLHPAFWFGMAMCDTESSPEFTKTCNPDTDANIFTSVNPSDSNYIGKHPGTAFMEMQFYPPGFAPIISCDATHWCAALNIDSLSEDQNSSPVTLNNDACLSTIGLEPVNFAFITKSGVADTPADPQNNAHFTANLANDLLMNPGDRMTVDLHDTPAGFIVVIHDATTGQTGSMTASTSNGFAQIKFDPNATSCTSLPYAFHPMYSTSSENTRVVWAAHSYNVAFSDEIGHWENCSAVDQQGGNCTSNNEAALDDDDFACFTPALGLLGVQIGGCLGSDDDFDGQPYQLDWPGTAKDHGQDKKLHPAPIMFSSPLFTTATGGLANFDRVAFETDLPRIEAPDSGGICNRTTGANCVNPPPGANFYPIYVTVPHGNSCTWAEGGAGIKNAGNTFGGNSTAEFGPLLSLVYPGAGFKPILQRFNNFRNVLSTNPCAANAQNADDNDGPGDDG